MLRYKKSPHSICVGVFFYLSHIFLSHSDFLLQPPSCVFEQFLHFPFLFSDFDIFSFLCLFCCYLSGQINNTPPVVVQQYVCFPKKIMGEIMPIIFFDYRSAFKSTVRKNFKKSFMLQPVALSIFAMLPVDGQRG